MYEDFYRFDKKPFTIDPDPNCVFWSETHKEALAHLRYGIEERKGFVVVTGAVGTGKTTLLQVLLSSLKKNVRYAIISNPSVTADDFFLLLGNAFHLCKEPVSKAQFLLKFSEFLKDSEAKGQKVLCIVDEAHRMPAEVLEEIRLLSNLDSAKEKVLSIFLVGQPELNDHLIQPQLTALRQRVSASYHLLPLDRIETSEYLKKRLVNAGAKYLNLFSPSAVKLLHKSSRGFPRSINILADQALLTGYVKGRKEINAEIIKEAIKDLKLAGEKSFSMSWFNWKWGTAAGIIAFVLGGLLYLIRTQQWFLDW